MPFAGYNDETISSYTDLFLPKGTTTSLTIKSRHDLTTGWNYRSKVKHIAAYNNNKTYVVPKSSDMLILPKFGLAFMIVQHVENEMFI